jgi:hypothetical protein
MRPLDTVKRMEPLKTSPVAHAEDLPHEPTAVNTAVGVDPAARVSGAAATRLTCQSPHGWDLQTGTLGALQRWALIKAALAARLRVMGPRGPLGRASHPAMEDIRLPRSRG